LLSQAIWWGGIAIEALLIGRGLRGHLASRYPAFYCYVAFVLFQDIFCFFAYRYGSQEFYRYSYWSMEFLCVLLSCWVVFEIYQMALADYPGTARMARVLLAILFGIALVKAFFNVVNDPGWWLEVTARDVEGALRAVQGLVLFGLAAICLFYAVPLAKNLRGIFLGYGAFVAWSVICLTLASSTSITLVHTLAYLYPISFLIVLGIWLFHLWSSAPSPVVQHDLRLEREYQQLAATTHRRLREVRDHFTKAGRL
jgi:hypothetical protein